MRFFLTDRVTAIDAESATALKTVSLAEEYLKEHFRTVPVLPGVMEIEGLTQLGGWWIRAIHGYDGAEFVSLRKLQNVRYGRFVRPGETIEYRVQLRSHEGTQYLFDATAEISDHSEKVLSARLTLETSTPSDPEVGAAMRNRQRTFFECCLWRGESLPVHDKVGKTQERRRSLVANCLS